MTQYPVFVMCGRDLKRRQIMEVLDPEGKYKVKALLPFLGKRVIDWQLEALRSSPYVEGLYLLGLSLADAAFDYPVQYVPVEMTADFPDKLAVGLEFLRAQGREPEMIVISSSDAPAMTTESANAFFFARLEELNGYDFVLSVVPEVIAEQEFPGTGRVVGRFTDHQVFPGELYALSQAAINRGQEVIGELHRRRRQINRRRKRISLAVVLRYLVRRPKTWPLILKFLLKRASLHDAEKVFYRAFACRATTVIIPDSGFGMDIDLPGDYEGLEGYVRRTGLAA